MTTRLLHQRRARLAACLALAAALIAVSVILLLGGSSYAVQAQFTSASGLIVGSPVKVAGRDVGKVDHIGLTRDGNARVSLRLTDSALTPLHVGTRATVRAIGQAGLANRYVELVPGLGGTPEIADGGQLGAAQTTSLVNYDAILDSFGPQQRKSLQTLIGATAGIYAGSGSRDFNLMLERLSPATRELASVSSQLADDRAAVGQLVRAGATAATSIASRRTDLEEAVTNTATSLRALAEERHALGSSLARAPHVVTTATRVLGATRHALDRVEPTLRLIPPAAKPLQQLVTGIDRTLPLVTPVVEQLRTALPDLRRTMAGLRPLAPVATRALRSAATALDRARPIIRVGRYYSPDLVLGVLAGLAAVAAANYNNFGHYARLEFTQPPQTTLGGPFAELLGSKPLVPGLLDLRTRLLRRCPGGAEPPAPDGSNPWVIPDVCTPGHDMPASVNVP